MHISGFPQIRSGTYWQEQVAAEHEAEHRRYPESPRERPAGNPTDLDDYISATLSDVRAAREVEK